MVGRPVQESVPIRPHQSFVGGPSYRKPSFRIVRPKVAMCWMWGTKDMLEQFLPISVEDDTTRRSHLVAMDVFVYFAANID